MPGGTTADGRLEVHVAARVPAEAIGAGAGMVSEYANTDLMGAYAGLGEDLSLGLEGLRVGDIVALEPLRPPVRPRLRRGCLTIGVISTGQCMLFGHGPGPSTLMQRAGGGVRGGHRRRRQPGELVPPGKPRPRRSAAMNDQPGSVSLAPVAVNLLGRSSIPALGDGPYRIDADGPALRASRRRRHRARRANWATRCSAAPLITSRRAPAWCTRIRRPGTRWPSTPASATRSS